MMKPLCILLATILSASAQVWTNAPPPVTPPGWTNGTSAPPPWWSGVRFDGVVAGSYSNMQFSAAGSNAIHAIAGNATNGVNSTVTIEGTSNWVSLAGGTLTVRFKTNYTGSGTGGDLTALSNGLISVGAVATNASNFSKTSGSLFTNGAGQPFTFSLVPDEAAGGYSWQSGGTLFGIRASTNGPLMAESGFWGNASHLTNFPFSNLPTTGGTVTGSVGFASYPTNAQWFIRSQAAGTSTVARQDQVLALDYNGTFDATNGTWTIGDTNQPMYRIGHESDWADQFEYNVDLAFRLATTNAYGYAASTLGGQPWIRIRNEQYDWTTGDYISRFASWYSYSDANFWRLHMQNDRFQAGASPNTFDVFGANGAFSLSHFGLTGTNVVDIAITASAGAIGTIGETPFVLGSGNAEYMRLSTNAIVLSKKIYCDGSGISNLPSATVTAPTLSKLLPSFRESATSSTNDLLWWVDQAGRLSGVSTTTASNNLTAAGFVMSATNTGMTAYRFSEFTVPALSTGMTGISFRVYDTMSTNSPPVYRFSLPDGSQQASYTGTVSAAGTWTTISAACPTWMTNIPSQPVQLRILSSFASLTNGVPRYQLMDMTYGVRLEK